jgi:ABC-type multidrug transport system ATPase subunit
MRVIFQGVSKRYKYEWIIKGVDYTFERGGNYAITGPNGSGKSTLLKMLSGHLSPSKGKVAFESKGKPVSPDDAYTAVSYAAPYIELIEEFTLKEAIAFHQRFKPFQQGLQLVELIDILAFTKAENKPVRHFSSGMKQRLKLALACCSQSGLLLLDEPTTNLDRQGMAWYRQLIGRFSAGKTVVVASNVEVDYDFCAAEINILNYK